MKHYDYLIVGSGLFGATFAYRARQAGKKCLVIDRRPHLGGNVYCSPYLTSPRRGGNIPPLCGRGDGGEAVINVHQYGAHIFHTSNKEVWDFVNSLVPFNRYTNCPIANYHGELYNLPFNMNTFNRMWPDVHTPAEAEARIAEQKAEALAALNGREPQNLEEQALCLVGKDIFYKLIKEYTEKQWGRDCKELPAFIIKRLPVRFVFDNNYFNDPYQGIPIGGYNRLINRLLSLSSDPSPAERECPGTNPSSVKNGKVEASPAGGGLVEALTGIDLPLNPPTRCLNHENGGYREMADPMNYELLRDNAKEMRKNPTEAESVFWQLVNGGQLGVKFRRQHVIGDYIADFVCLEKNLIVEIDGGYHDDPEQQIEDNLRSTVLKEYGFAILRIRNEEVLDNTSALLEKLKLALWLAEKVPLREGFREAADQLVYTGPIDEYFGYKFGRLDWRTVMFKTRVEDTPNYQGNAVINYTSHDVPYTRVIEHKHFEMFGQAVYDCPKTVVSEEYSTEYKPGMEQFYPVNDERNNALAEQYRALTEKEENVIFGGRLAEYKYYDMAPIIEKVLKMEI